MDGTVKTPVNCETFREWLVHFQADEVAEGDRGRLQEHLDACPGCSRRLEIEDGMLRALRARLEPTPAPPGLETRIRAALAEQSPAPAAIAWYRRPWLAAAAASLTLAVLLFQGVDWPGIDSSRRGVVEVSWKVVTVVDRDCDKAGASYAQQLRCRRADHLNALKVSDGNYWHLSADQELSRRLMLDRTMRGKRLAVDGELYSAIHTLQLARYRQLPPTTL